jgi:hypothetical protein
MEPKTNPRDHFLLRSRSGSHSASLRAIVPTTIIGTMSQMYQGAPKRLKRWRNPPNIEIPMTPNAKSAAKVTL